MLGHCLLKSRVFYKDPLSQALKYLLSYSPKLGICPSNHLISDLISGLLTHCSSNFAVLWRTNSFLENTLK